MQSQLRATINVIFPLQEERTDPEPTHLAEPQRAFCGGQRSGYQNPAHALQFPQIQRVSLDMHY